MTGRVNPDLLRQIGYEESLEATVVEILQTSTHPFKDGWSPQVCTSIALRMRFPEKIWDSSTQRAMTIRFLTFYASGNVEDTFEVTDIILGMASLCFQDNVYQSNGLIWKPQDPNDNTPLLFDVDGRPSVVPSANQSSDSETDTAPQIINVSDIQDLQTHAQIAPLTLEPPKLPRLEENVGELLKKNLDLLYNYKAGDLKAFIEFCQKILIASPASNAPTREAINLMRLCNMLALTMLRAVTKTGAQLTAGFLKRQFRTNISNLIGGKFGQHFAPPCGRCIENVCMSINKSHQNISCFMAKIVSKWAEETPETTQMRAVLEASVLTHTSWNGLGILDMLFVICDFYATSWLRVMRLSAISSTSASWKTIIEFMKVYQRKGEQDRTIPWARVIDDSYFKRFSPMYHYVLASHFIASIEGAQNDSAGVEDAVWAINHRSTVVAYREASKWLRDQLSHCAAPKEAATPDALPLLHHIRDSGPQSKLNPSAEEDSIDADIL